MASRRQFLFLLTGVLLSVARTAVVVAGQETVRLPQTYCSTKGNFSNASEYQVNLANLLAELPRAAMDGRRGFADRTAGDAPDQVFGLTMCYALSDWFQCQDCLRKSAASVQQECPFSREAKLGDESCLLRYSDESFFSVADLSIAYEDASAATVDDAGGIVANRSKLLARLTDEAASNALRLANGTVTYKDSRGSLQVMHGLAQCTRDLNASECTRCLTKYQEDELSSDCPDNSRCSIRGYSCLVAYGIGEDLGVTIPPDIAAAPVPPPSATPRPLPGPASPPPGPPAGRFSAALVAGLSAGFLVLVICTIFLVWFLLRRRRRRKARALQVDVFDDNDPLEEEFEQGAGPRRFRYSELAAATGFFSEDEKLGEGGFGSVYRGYLRDMDLHVAIKRVSKSSRQGRNEYVSEVKIISRLRHRNLVQLVGWCHGGGELLLVYELMPNGSLDIHIHNQNSVMSWRLW